MEYWVGLCKLNTNFKRVIGQGNSEAERSKPRRYKKTVPMLDVRICGPSTPKPKITHLGTSNIAPFLQRIDKTRQTKVR
jgi:hypothetical protein